MKLGYHPATFPGEGFDRLVASLPAVCECGWDGLEYSARVMEPWFDRPDEVRAPLDDAGLIICALYYTCGFADDAEVAAWLDHGRRVAEFCITIGCPHIMIDGGRKDGGGGEDQIARAAEAANEMGRLCAEHDLTCTWHQHWGTIFEYEEPFERLMSLTDPDLVRFTPDTAQLALGDFDVPGTIRRHADRIVYAHFKDLGEDRRFIELGRGTIDLQACWQALQSGGFGSCDDHWLVVDLDYTDLQPAEACAVNKRFLNETLGVAGARDRCCA